MKRLRPIIFSALNIASLGLLSLAGCMTRPPTNEQRFVPSPVESSRGSESRAQAALVLQRECLAHHGNSDRIVYERATGADPVVGNGNGDPFAYSIDSWSRLSKLLEPGILPPYFMHERTTPSGKPRLVVVGITAAGGGAREAVFLNFAGVVIGPGTDSALPKVLRASNIEALVAPPARLRIYVGMADKQDASRFTMAYMLGDEPGDIEFRLKDDDRIEMNVISGPLREVGPPKDRFASP